MNRDNLKELQWLGLRGLTTLTQAKESNSKTLKPATFENLTILELSKRYNASLNRRQRITQAAALRLKHHNYRKPKVPSVGCRFEAFVSCAPTLSQSTGPIAKLYW